MLSELATIVTNISSPALKPKAEVVVVGKRDKL